MSIAAALATLAVSAIAADSGPASTPGTAAASADGGWPAYANAPGGGRYSPLRQIDRGNVAGLEVVWTFRTGDLGPSGTETKRRSFQATPVLTDGVLYLSTGYGLAYALDAATGTARWRYDARVRPDVRYAETGNRGVALWRDTAAASGAACAHRVFMGTLDARLIALDAATGQPCADFGRGGQVALKDPAWGLDDARGEYGLTSPPTVAGDLVIVGSAIGDNRSKNVEPGVVRAFDARTGALRWSWNPVPPGMTAANAWAPMSIDPSRDLLFVPTGSAAPDFFGGERAHDNRHANSVVALRASTGELIWSRQLVHHDLWDYDLPAQPMLVDLKRDGATVPAVVQATKMGMVYVLHRETGEPLYPIEERAAPPSDVPGEQPSPTQPVSTLPALVRQQPLKPDDAWGVTFWDRGRCRDQIAQHRSDGIYTPPSLRGSIEMPGYSGGSNWGGLAWDPATQTVYANVSDLAFVVALVPRDRFEAERDSGDYDGWQFTAQAGTPYGVRRRLLKSPFGLPCVKPPWGRLAALDLSDAETGRLRWQVPIGTTRDQAPWPFWFDHGMPNMGGPLVTAGGLVFLGATTDNFLRAFDTATGRVLWEGRLPSGGQASPMSYEAGGRQFVVIAAGGHSGMGTTLGDSLVAFALPAAGR